MWSNQPGFAKVGEKKCKNLSRTFAVFSRTYFTQMFDIVIHF